MGIHYYGTVVDRISEDGATFLLDDEATDLFFECLEKDMRFRPEILRYTDDQGSVVTSGFAPFNDHLKHLRQEMGAFILGYLAKNPENFIGLAIGEKNQEHVNPLTYADYKRLN